MREDLSVGILFVNQVSDDIHFEPTNLGHTSGMANDVPNVEPVGIDKKELTHAALGQFDSCVGASGTETEAEYRLVTENCGFQNAGTPCGERWLNVDHGQ